MAEVCDRPNSGTGSTPTRSWRPSARAVWARCIRRATLGSSATVAIKVLPQSFDSESDRERFQREPRNFGRICVSALGKYEKGIEVDQQLVEIDPDVPIAYLQLAFNHQFAGHLVEAERALQRASARKLEIPELAVQRYDIAFLKGDQAGMDREAALAQSAADDLVLDREGFVLAYSGHLKAARSMAQQRLLLACDPRASRIEGR